MSKVKFAVIGAGLIGPRHARTVAADPDAELVAIVDPMPGGAKLASELSTAHYKSIADLVASPDKPDAAIICTPNHTHVPVATELSDAGINILIEKPFSTDIPSGKNLLEHLGKTGVTALVGHHRRFNPYMVAAKKIVDSGKIGTIIAINGIWTLYKPDDYFQPPTEWRQSSTGGVILINMIHEVDLLHYLLGPILTVHAEKAISRRGFVAEEGAALTFRFKSGVVGTFVIADNVPSPYNFESGTGENPTIPKTGADFYRIFGTEAALSVPDMSIWSHEGVKTWLSPFKKETYPVQDAVPFELQVRHFIKAIRGQEKPNCTAQAGLAALMVCEAIRTALDNNSTETLEPYEL
ncbi:quinate utilization oxidoreductase [Kockiozyma suomiensis]|uniref:quinate utilization oxidoreductase n=1 Tax=Kockiozyma suomiensis TaxID=1337062 RepID=UPI003343706D